MCTHPRNMAAWGCPTSEYSVSHYAFVGSGFDVLDQTWPGNSCHRGPNALSPPCSVPLSRFRWVTAPPLASGQTYSWLPGGTICSFAPNLFRVIGSRRCNRTVREALLNRQWARDINAAPTAQVLCEYVHLWKKLETVHLSPLESDRFVWKWTKNGDYTASSTY